MKTPKEIKKGLEHCVKTGMACGICNYEIRCLKTVRGKPVMQDALVLIKRFEADNAEKDKRIAELEQELATVKRERDAAVADLGPDCCTCKHKGETERCRWSPCGYEWRGVCPDTEVQVDG
jgi:hypothetical protein